MTDSQIQLDVNAHNGSALPVRHVAIRVLNDSDNTIYYSYHSVLPPGVTFNNLGELHGDDVFHDHYRTSMTFTDSSGKRWKRDPAGKLGPLPDKFTLYSGVDVKKGLDRYRKLFREQFSLEVEVNTSHSGHGLREFFGSKRYEGGKCDAIVGPHDWLGTFRARSLLRSIPIPHVVPKDFLTREAFETFRAAEGSVESYGVPLAYDTAVLFINRKLYQGEIPKSVPEMFRAGRACRHAGEDDVNIPGVSVSMGERLHEGDPFMMWPLLASLGGYLFEPQGDDAWLPSANALRAPQLAEALIALQGIAREYPESFDPRTTHATARQIFSEGSTPFHIDTAGARSEMKCDFEPELAPVPIESEIARPGLSLIYAFYFRDIPSPENPGNQDFERNEYTRNGEDFLHYHLGSRIVCSQLSGDLGMPVVSRSGLVDEGAYAAVVQQCCSNSRPMPSLPNMADVWRILGELINQCVSTSGDSRSVRAALDVAADNMDGALGVSKR
ncbi:sugar ABC transporter substrate-binding protein [Ornithinimicrobium sp. W1665]|uniref:sugar ABC transporter substrate-binding protein n=1 Tax=Ornithinimicrobium sp. W1665 TaxID=3416666 RepID=UPI003CEE11B9